MRSVAIFTLVLLAGCGDAKQPGPVQDGPPTPPPVRLRRASPAAATDAPPARLAPQDITMADIEKYDLSGMGCVFVPQGRKEAVALLEGGESQLKLKARWSACPPPRIQQGTRLRHPLELFGRQADAGDRSRSRQGGIDRPGSAGTARDSDDPRCRRTRSLSRHGHLRMRGLIRSVPQR